MSDLTRMQLINNFFENVEKDPNYNIENPDYDMLVDDWDGYDDQTYIKNELINNKIIYYEGFVKNCWIALYKNPEYKGLSKREAIEKLINDRFTKIAKEFNMIVSYYDYYTHDYLYIMQITLKKED